METILERREASEVSKGSSPTVGIHHQHYAHAQLQKAAHVSRYFVTTEETRRQWNYETGNQERQERHQSVGKLETGNSIKLSVLHLTKIGCID